MAYHNENDKISKIKDKLSLVTSMMMDNIEEIELRGEKLNDIVVNAEELETNAKNFHKASKNLKWKVIGSVIILTIIAVVIFTCCLLILVLIVVLIYCLGVPSANRCQQKK